MIHGVFDDQKTHRAMDLQLGRKEESMETEIRFIEISGYDVFSSSG